MPNITTANFDKVAVRAPDHAIARELIQIVGEPLAAPSANASGRVSPTTAAHVLETLNYKIDAVLDGGPCRFGLESTVVDVTKNPPMILRAGALAENEIAAVFPNIQIRAEGAPAGGDASPGLLAKHYAPAVGEIILIKSVDMPAAWRLAEAILLTKSSADELSQKIGPRANITEILPAAPVEFARELYAALYRLERAAPARLFIEMPPDDPEWRAVRDRLTRAAARET